MSLSRKSFTLQTNKWPPKGGQIEHNHEIYKASLFAFD